MSIPVRVAGQRWQVFDPEDDAVIIVEIDGAPGTRWSGPTHFRVIQVIKQRGEYYKIGKITSLGFNGQLPWVYELLEGQEKPL